MEIICPQCKQKIGTAESVARLILTVHCPFDGNDFGVAVDPPEPASAPLPPLTNSAPPA
jgi:hypothetical protein